MAAPTQPAKQSSRAEQVASFRRVLTNRNFLLLWLAQLISQTILNTANFGVVVLVQNTTRSALLVSLAVISFLLPGVPFSALAGVIVDRLNKRSVLWVNNLLRGCTMLLIFASLLHDETAFLALFALMFLTSLISQFFSPAEGASIPLLVGEQELMPALALFNVTITVAQALGYLLLGRVMLSVFPPFTLMLGALPLHVKSVDMLFAMVAVLYGVCTLLILCIPRHAFVEQSRQQSRVGKKPFVWRHEVTRLWHDVVGIYHIVRADRILFFSVIQLSLAGIIMQLIGALSPTYVQQIMLRPAEDLSIVMAPAAVGLVGGSLFMPRIARRLGKVRITPIGLAGFGFFFTFLSISQFVAWIVHPFHWQQSLLLFVLVLVTIFMLGIAMACINIPAQTLLQEHTPEEFRAGVLSLQYTLFSAGSIPVLLFSGTLAQFLGLNPVIIVISLALLLISWWSMRYVRVHR
ncbi:MAG TPA: MFS transporter [Ktedonobacteraceae bacterium]|jgi:MFS family permease|nr:MFS transporter [Ktedonobacteraceae bacterium]